MDAFSELLNGFAVALTPMNLLWALLGCTLGTAIGVLPGLGPALTIALLLPITYKVEPTSAFILFAGIYYGAMYGGSTTSILLNTPGESATIVTALEGNKMARNGRAGAALATAAIGSFVAGTIGTLGITFLAPVVVDWALRFGPADYFSLMVFAFVTGSAVLGSSVGRGRGRDPDLSELLHREEALLEAAGVRQRRDRRGRRPGGRQQRLGRRRAGADAHARPAHIGDRRDHAFRVPKLRHQSRAAAAAVA